VPIVVAGLTHGHAALDRQSAGLSLSFFGICFVAARLLFANTINRWGGYRVAIAAARVSRTGRALARPATRFGPGRVALTGFGFALVHQIQAAIE
jgi:hypothetical protein